jgi:outer membrane lipoprotein-sorting protein
MNTAKPPLPPPRAFARARGAIRLPWRAVTYLLVFASVWLAGCNRDVRPEGVAVSQPVAAAEGETVDALDTARLESAIQGRRAAVAAFGVKARVTVRTDQGSLPIDMDIVVAAPSKVRIEARTLLGSLLSVVVHEGDRRTALDLGSEVYFEGPLDSPTARKFMPIKLTAEEWVALVTANVPAYVADSLEAQPAGRDSNDAAFTATLKGGAQLSGIVEPRTGVPRKLTIRRGKRTLLLNFEGYRLTETYPFPERFRLDEKDGRRSLAAEITDVNRTPEIDADTFNLPLPPGMSRLEE